MATRVEYGRSIDGPRLRKLKTKWLYAGAAVVIIGAGAPFAMHRLNAAKPAATTMVYKVGYGNMVQSVSTSGTLQPASTADLSFADSAAKVTKISVKVGQTVKAGQVLAQEDDTATKAALFSAQSAVAQAKASLAAAQANLVKVEGGASSTTLATGQQAVLRAELALKAAQQSYQSQLAASQNSAANQQKLLIAQTTLQNDQQAANDTSGVDIAKSQLALDQQILASDEANVKTLQSMYGSITPAQIQAAYQQYQQSQQALNRQQMVTPQQQTSVAQQQSNYTTMSQGYAALQSAIQSVARDRLTVQRDEQSVAAAENALTRARQKVTIDQQNLQLVQQQVNNTSAVQASLASAQLQIQMDQIALQSAQTQLQQDQLPPNPASVASAQAGVQAAQANLLSTQNALLAAQSAENQTKLVAPVNGVVSLINGKVGQPAGSASAAGASGAFIKIVDTNTNDLQIPIQLNQSQISQVKAGDVATITMPTAPGVTYKGTITQVSPTPTVTATANASAYTATALVQNTNGALKVGMMANVSIQTADQSHVVTIPSIALQQVGGQEGVYVVGPSSAGSGTAAATSGQLGTYAGPFTGGSLSNPTKLPSDVHFQPVQANALGTGDVQVTSGLAAGQEILVQVPASGIPSSGTTSGGASTAN
ncbi:HlyD family efflux transporter periplasmic adaptor subunit [Alicyclobacillus mengziensis]|uniref:HlyD family efflux transporter periplasmic adaptor subunit n=1 Tax=Alicyclobacillus mengziensis TaxID=2931921 RepID=A0A9X7VZ21_9BACL|nr:HlyD family efflux transporter periplasmic adaptor subunit [Alicyclobacillus mengziensis]QSO47190.1 HlyD family efflux transporter periplasmic adaptor subunit [Alicyclobacillus mengziensis]